MPTGCLQGAQVQHGASQGIVVSFLALSSVHADRAQGLARLKLALHTAMIARILILLHWPEDPAECIHQS